MDANLKIDAPVKTSIFRVVYKETKFKGNK